jgi:hypothetical protein
VNKADRRHYDDLERSGVLPNLRRLVASSCVPLWWEVQGKHVIHNGTMCLVQTPEALFGVTCRHVLEAYLVDKHTLPDVFCQLGGGPFDPSANVISSSKAWDLATFRIPGASLMHLGAQRRVFQALTWPPPPMQNGERIILGGYPEARRETGSGPRPKTLGVDMVTFLSSVDNARPESMAIGLASDNWYWPQGSGLDRQAKLSGTSGGPCFRLSAEPPNLELVGFIFEGNVPSSS